MSERGADRMDRAGIGLFGEFYVDVRLKPGIALGFYLGRDCYGDPMLMAAAGPLVVTVGFES